MLRESTYWFQLAVDEPVLAVSGCGFFARDRLLLETDRNRFPRERHFLGDLCVVRLGMSQPILKLAAVYYEEGSEGEPEGLFPTCSIASRTPKMSSPSPSTANTPTASRSPGQAGRTSRRGGRPAYAARRNSDFGVRPKEIKYADVVAVWTNILERTDSFPSLG